MMTAGLHIVLLAFAIVGYAGTGASLAVARARFVNDGERDIGMFGVAGMLFMFGALCTLVGSGIAGVLALGGVALWVGYVVTAQRLGLFTVETGLFEHEHEHEPRQTT